MPLYTFRCRKCGGITQVTHEFREPHPEKCSRIVLLVEFPLAPLEQANEPLPTEICGGEFDRLFDAPNVVYRDSGFYTVDKRLTPVLPEDYNPDED